MRRVLLISSLVGIGRAGLYPQLVALERRGIQPCPQPSAVLSTHLGGFGAPSRALLGDQVAGALKHYLSLGIEFDALITGYLPEPSLADDIISFLDAGGAKLYLCDPVMADGGAFYSGMGAAHADGYRRLAARANAITPNAAEANILLGRAPDAPSDIEELSRALASDRRAAVITGGGDKRTVACACAKGARVETFTAPRARGRFVGTGDLFSAELAANLLDGASVFDAARKAFEAVSARCFAAGEGDRRLGLEIEGK